MKTRGLGHIYQPTFRDLKTGEKRTSPTWWIQYSDRGTRHRESSKSTKRSDAVRLLRRRLKEMDEDAPIRSGVTKEDPGTIHRLLTDANARYVVVTNEELRQMKSPLVYAYVADGTFLYIGMSKDGLSRPLNGSHHILKDVPITDGTSTMYFPVATAEEARALEGKLIQLLKPKWNHGGKPQPDVSDEELGAAVQAVSDRYRAQGTEEIRA